MVLCYAYYEINQTEKNRYYNKKTNTKNKTNRNRNKLKNTENKLMLSKGRGKEEWVK